MECPICADEIMIELDEDHYLCERCGFETEDGPEFSE
jgi:ribosomal protein S27AE